MMPIQPSPLAAAHAASDRLMAQSRAYRDGLRWSGRVQGFFVGLLVGAAMLFAVLAIV